MEPKIVNTCCTNICVYRLTITCVHGVIVKYTTIVD